MKSMRVVSTYKVRGKEFKVGSLLWGDFLLLNEQPQEGYLKIISEFNKEPPFLNKRQMEALFQSLTKKNTLKKEKGLQKKMDIEQLFLIEGALMHYLNQELSTIRNWTLEYTMSMVELLPAVTGQSNYDEIKNKNKPDKKAIKSLKKDLKK